MSRSTLTRVLGYAIAFLTAFQLISATDITPWHDNATASVIVSVVVMYLVNVLTAWYQWASHSIDTSTGQAVTIVAAVVITIGGLLDLAGVLPIPANWAVWIRFVITLTLAVITGKSSQWFPVQTKQ